MNLPTEVESSARRHEHDAPRHLHALELQLATLVLESAPTEARARLAVAERFMAGAAGLVELQDARQDAWTYIGSLACGCSAADSASAQLILMCLEPDQSRHTLLSLLEQLERALTCGVTPERLLEVLRPSPPWPPAPDGR